MNANRNMRAAIAMAVACLATFPAVAGEVIVRYVDPDHFSDLATARSEERPNMDALSSHLQQLGARLPAGQVLRIDVLDVDLAGWVRHGRAGDRRIVEGRADAPHFHLRYTLEANGRVVKSGDDRLVDIDYTGGLSAIGPGRGPLFYEKRMLSKWFAANFVPESQAAR